MDILKEVKNRTRPWHDEMEAVAFSDKIAAGNLSLHQYKAIILGHYLFHREAERQLVSHQYLLTPEGLVLEDRLKSGLLAQDVEQLQLRPYLFDFQLHLDTDSLAKALGCMYVMEGATLGGTVIERSLSKVSAIRSSGAMHYYGCYGEQTGRRWKQFREIIVQNVVSEEEAQEFINTATATFRAYAGCMEAAKRQLHINVSSP